MRHGSVTYFTPEGKPVPPEAVPLNEQGVAQAQAAGRLFTGVRFDRVIASGLPRTVETARLVLAESGQDLAIEPRAALQEIRSGRLGSIPLSDLQRSFTGVMDGTATLETRFLGGESVGELLARVIPEVDALRTDDTWETLLMVLHGGVNRAIISYLLTGEKRLMGAFEQSPACINVIDVGAAPRDVIFRATNLSPTDWLQHDTRSTTMEALFGQYARYRNRNGTSEINAETNNA